MSWRHWWVISICFFLGAVAKAQDTFQPADLNQGSNPLAHALHHHLKVMEERSFVIHFAADVDRQGRVVHFRVMRVKPKHVRTSRFLPILARKARVRPATIEGRPTRVGLNGMLVGSHEGKGFQLRLVQHLGYVHPTVGWDYLGPQAVGGHQRLRRLMRVQTPSGLAHVAVAFDVSKLGDTSRFLILKDSHPDAHLGERWSKVLSGTLFLPGNESNDAIDTRTAWEFFSEDVANKGSYWR